MTGVRFTPAHRRDPAGFRDLGAARSRVITDVLPGEGRDERPFPVSAAVGEDATLRSGEVRVTRIDGAKKISQDRTSMTTPGVWVIVDYTWTPREESIALGNVAIRAASGQRWLARAGRNVQACGASVPGLPLRCHAAIEMPPELVPDASIEMGLVRDDDRYDSLAVVPLGVDRAEVDRWLARSEIVPIRSSRIGAP